MSANLAARSLRLAEMLGRAADAGLPMPFDSLEALTDWARWFETTIDSHPAIKGGSYVHETTADWAGNTVVATYVQLADEQVPA